MIPTSKQEQKSDEAVEILRKYRLVYLAMEERTGKTLTAIRTAEKLGATKVLVLTKLAPIKGWEDTLAAYAHTFSTVLVTNYHQAKNVKGTFELVILDEAHNYISGYPKRSAMNKEVAKLVKGKYLIYSSATPHAQGLQLLYHQFYLSSWSPFAQYKNAYLFHAALGIPDLQWIGGVPRETYKKVKADEVLKLCQHLFVYATRAEMGYEKEPEDVLHFIELDPVTKDVYNVMMKDRVIELNGLELVLDKVAKLRATLHMLEGGVMKVDEAYHVLGNREKVDYILDTWGDTPDVVIMYHYKAEKLKLEAIFKHALLLQGTTNAEGIDLHKYAHLIIYSQDWSTARHSQRRARQANKAREEDIKVHFLLCKGAISEEVYKTVSVNKTNYIDSCFKGQLL